MQVKEHILVSMTSWYRRINNVKRVLDTLLIQTIRPYKIILNLCTEDFPNMEEDLPEDLLTLDYSIDLYVDGKLVVPNQNGSCDEQIHHRPINTHYKGRTENLEGFQKVTFFAPARGRIPRIVFSINCESDINVLEYAIVYMQLNAK